MSRLLQKGIRMIIKWARKIRLQTRSKKEKWISKLEPYYDAEGYEQRYGMYDHIVDMNDYFD